MSIDRRSACLTLLASLLSPRHSLFAAEKGGVKLPMNKQKLHIYLLLGQSNMSGRGFVFKEDRELNDQIIALGRDEHWIHGSEPLHWDKPPGIVGVGPGRAFAIAMLNEMPREAEGGERAVIALVPCAETGSSLSDWQKGGTLYNKALGRARRAMKDGVLKGILWHQGETDAAKPTLAVTYGARLQEMVVDLRKDLGQGPAPFVCGKLSELIPANRFPEVAAVNKGLEELSKKVPFTDCASSQGLTLMADGVHFDAPSQRLLGKRYAGLMNELLKKAGRK